MRLPWDESNTEKYIWKFWLKKISNEFASLVILHYVCELKQIKRKVKYNLYLLSIITLFLVCCKQNQDTTITETEPALVENNVYHSYKDESGIIKVYMQYYNFRNTGFYETQSVKQVKNTLPVISSQTNYVNSGKTRLIHIDKNPIALFEAPNNDEAPVGILTKTSFVETDTIFYNEILQNAADESLLTFNVWYAIKINGKRYYTDYQLHDYIPYKKKLTAFNQTFLLIAKSTGKDEIYDVDYPDDFFAIFLDKNEKIFYVSDILDFEFENEYFDAKSFASMATTSEDGAFEFVVADFAGSWDGKKFKSRKINKYGIKERGKTLEEMIPSGWNVLSHIYGDLNNDGVTDLVFVIQSTNSDYFEESDDFGTVDLNPRVLGIYFGNERGSYNKHLLSDQFIVLRDSPTMDEPLDELQITDSGVLKIGFRFWYSAGTWFTSRYTYTFRFQNNQFELIGYDSYSGHRASGETTEYSVNFSTGKMNIIKGNFSSDEPESSVWRTFELENLKSLESFGAPFEWEFEGIYI